MSSNVYTLSDFNPGGRLYREESESASLALEVGDLAIKALQELGELNQQMCTQVSRLDGKVQEALGEFSNKNSPKGTWGDKARVVIFSSFALGFSAYCFYNSHCIRK